MRMSDQVDYFLIKYNCTCLKEVCKQDLTVTFLKMQNDEGFYQRVETLHIDNSDVLKHHFISYYVL